MYTLYVELHFALSEHFFNQSYQDVKNAQHYRLKQCDKIGHTTGQQNPWLPGW